ncbi:MAG: DUF2231 domain-containing protein [Xanthomonadales bacterium]|nr:DUF2231 domain-containing protein [Xanthomonadales bacterium]
MRHPIHPALVHFPVACWSLATLADLASLYFGQPAWWLAGVLMTIGIVCAVPAAAAGFMELMRLADDHPALKDVNRHMSMVMIVFTFYTVSLLLRVDDTTLQAPGWIAIVLSVCGFACLAVAGWLGGRLVYQHHLGS